MRLKVTKRNFMRAFPIFLLLSVIFTIPASAQEEIFRCNYQGKKINESAICGMLGFKSRPEATEAVNEIVRRSGLKQNFYVMECPNIDNCFAAVRDGERLIVYDAAFMRKVNGLTKTDWGAMSILAHEIGHHLQGHTLKTGGSEQSKEIEADEFSGFVMYQMGASLNEAQSAIRQLTTDYDSGTHPPRSQRMGAIKRGYENAAALYPSVQQKNNYDENSNAAPANEEQIASKKEERISEKKNTSESNASKTGCITGDCKYGYGVAVNRYTKEKYAGGWNLGKREGIGIEFYKDGNKKYEGEFKESRYHGKGRYYFENGDIFEGYFENGEMNGDLNVYYYKNGDRLFVKYEQGVKQGKAKIVFADGTVSQLYFKDDKVMKR